MGQNISVQNFIKSAAQTAHHFGFSPLERIKNHPSCKNCESKVQHKSTAQDRKNDSLHGLLAGGMSSYFDHKLNAIEGPVLFYSLDAVPRTGDVALTLQAFNVRKSIGEAVLIQTIRSLLSDLGVERFVVRINSLGDTDSSTRYVRDLTNFLRKRIEEMPTSARELMKEHSIAALMHLIEREHDLARRSPNPLEYLTDASRKHFREIVEFLDMSGTPFEIDPKLIGHHECYSDALFSFELLDENRAPLTDSPISIRGGRYNTFVQRMSKMKTPAVGATLILKDKKLPSNVPTMRAPQESSAYLVQLGFGPKVKSLLLMDELRRAGISIRQNILSDSLSEQLRHAESTNARYAIILGHKEFMDGTIIIRDLHQQNQEHIPVTTLASYLRKVTA